MSSNLSAYSENYWVIINRKPVAQCGKIALCFTINYCDWMPVLQVETLPLHSLQKQRTSCTCSVQYQQIRKWRCPLSSTSVFIKLICSGLAREPASLTATQSLDERVHSGQYQKGELLTWSHIKASSRDLFFWGVELWKSKDMSKTIILCWKEKSYSNVLRPARMTKEVSWQWNVSMVGFENLCHHAFRSLQISCSQSFKTSGNPSSDEMWRWHGEKPVSPVVTQSSPQLQGYQCTCLCFHEWLWLMCFTAATSLFHLLCAGMME